MAAPYSSDVLALQQSINRFSGFWSFQPIKADGLYGPATLDKVQLLVITFFPEDLGLYFDAGYDPIEGEAVWLPFTRPWTELVALAPAAFGKIDAMADTLGLPTAQAVAVGGKAVADQGPQATPQQKADAKAKLAAAGGNPGVVDEPPWFASKWFLGGIGVLAAGLLAWGIMKKEHGPRYAFAAHDDVDFYF